MQNRHSSAREQAEESGPGMGPGARDDGQAWALASGVAPGGVLLLNDDGVCVYVTERCADLLGRSRSELLGQRPDAWLASPLADLTRPAGTLEAGETAFRTTLRVSLPDGEPRWLEATSSRLHPRPGELVSTVVHLADISSSITLERALGRAVHRYVQILDTIDESVLQLDAYLRVSGFNRQLTRLAGLPAESLLGRPAFEVLDLRDSSDRPLRPENHALPALLAEPAEAGDDGPWVSLARADGTREFVRAHAASYETVRTSEDAHLIVFSRTPGTRAGQGPSMRHARAAVGLTTREGDVLDGLASGRGVQEIAVRLGISVHSVRTHLKGLTAKLGVRSQLQALVVAVQDGLVTIEEPIEEPQDG